MNQITEATNILRKPLGWIQLDIDIDLNKWQEEAKVISDYLVKHRESEPHVNWKGCCIHGISTNSTGHWSKYADYESEVSYHWTELSKEVPTITKFWKNFPVESFARLRFMTLDPGGRISPHSDAPDGVKNTDFDMMDHIIPINLAITHPDNCDMYLKEYGKVPWAPGKVFIVNVTDTHYVNNNSDQTRIHMIAHCIVGNKKKEFSDLVVRSYNKYHDK